MSNRTTAVPYLSSAAQHAWRHLVEAPRPGARIAIVVAHPDDEVIGIGAQLHRWATNAICVYATDGSPADERDARAAGFTGGAAYAAARAAEARAALAIAGIPPGQIRHLRFRDQQLIDDVDALALALDGLLTGERPDFVLTHAFEGGHPDHDTLSLAVGRAVTAAQRHGADIAPVIEFAGYFEGADGSLVTNRFASASGSERQLRMSSPDRRRKEAMLACFATQQHVLQRFGSAEEWLRLAPRYDFRRQPNGGRAWYDRLGWAMTSAEWTGRAISFLDRVPLPSVSNAAC